MSPAGVALVALVVVFSPGIVQTCARACRRPDPLDRELRALLDYGRACSPDCTACSNTRDTTP
ncbi:hypothetical protein ACFQ67_00525 [Streptomyces sp. NPDC056488]|uniref:hypothetical protein n=1 Tax=Streptomyces sp. NPDC056488 TaxID=3345836 RepID=UPI0036B030FF